MQSFFLWVRELNKKEETLGEIPFPSEALGLFSRATSLFDCFGKELALTMAEYSEWKVTLEGLFLSLIHVLHKPGAKVEFPEYS